MDIKQLFFKIFRLEYKVGIAFSFIVAILLIWIILSVNFVPNTVTEDQITSPQVIKARDVCKDIPVPEQFSFVSSSFGQRVGGYAHYRNLYRTDLSFDEVFEFYKNVLPEKGFNGGYWRDSVGERQISFGKDKIGITISYRTAFPGLLEYLRKQDWKVYIHCDDRNYNKS